jgi:hypothetical protein
MRGLIWTGAVLMVALIVVLSLWPLTVWRAPVLIPNGAERTFEGGLRFPEPGIARSVRPPEWLKTLKTEPDQTLTIALKLRSYRVHQKGPSRILTLSRTPLLRDLTIGQEGSHLILRLRGPWSDRNGLIDGRNVALVPNVFADKNWRDVLVAVSSDRLQIHCDGGLVLDQALEASPFPAWEGNFNLALGNEFTFDRPWLGEIAVAEVTVGETKIDYARHNNLKLPKVHWDFVSIPRFSPFDDLETIDAIANVLFYLPLGLLLGWLAYPRIPWLSIAAICALSSAMEVLQIAIPGRIPASSDLITNNLGGILGIALAIWIRSRWEAVLAPKLRLALSPLSRRVPRLTV